MLRSMLLVALRNFKKDKWYSLLNILGLTIGVTFGMFLILYVKDELSFDRHYAKADRIYLFNILFSTRILTASTQPVRSAAPSLLLSPC
ncbi:MAG: ABC transporter permease [Flavihumibacter sp.]